MVNDHGQYAKGDACQAGMIAKPTIRRSAVFLVLWNHSSVIPKLAGSEGRRSLALQMIFAGFWLGRTRHG